MTVGDAAARVHARRGALGRLGLGADAALLVAAAGLLGAFVVQEQRTAAPLVRLGILRSGALVRANLGAMMLIGGWVGFQFIATLYLQQLRGWSALETGLAIFPEGLLVALPRPRIAPLIAALRRRASYRAGMASLASATRSSCRSALHSRYGSRCSRRSSWPGSASRWLSAR